MGHSLGNNYGKFYSFLSKPVELDLSFIVDATNGNGLGVRSVKGQGVKNVFMHTSSTPGSSNGYLNPNPAVGYALVELEYNYTRVYGGPLNIVAPVTGGNLAINGSALTAGLPYVITAVGHASAGAVTVAPVADVAGSLASTWFRLYDAYGNTFIIWFSVSGVGAAPVGVSGTLVQQSISTNDSAATIGTALAVTIGALYADTPQNPGAPHVFSFTTAGTTTVTVTSTQTNPYGPLPGAPADGTIATGFAFAKTVYSTNLQDWQGVGLPKGVVPAVGVSFIATATGFSTGGGSTGTVKAVGVSGITSVETIGNANLSLAPIPMGGSPNSGGWILLKLLAPSFAAGAFTPAGTINAQTFTGSALASHNHDLTVIGGQASATTNDIANYAGPILGKEEATNATYLGANSATNGGVVGASAGTPAGSVSQATFTGSAASLTGTITMAAAAPANESVISMILVLEGATQVGGNQE